MMQFFPVDKLKQRARQYKGKNFVPEEGTIPINQEPIDRTTIKSRITGRDHPFHLLYKGRVSFIDKPYYYYIFYGTMTIAQVIKTLAGKLNRRYLTSNDPYEMDKFIGRTGARVNHEYLYSVELKANKTPLLYQHITLICRNIFGLHWNPITPNGFLHSPGINAIDAISFENYKKNLSNALVKGAVSSTDTITTSVIVGRPPNIGTAYITFVADNDAKRKVIESYTEARYEQRYEGRYAGISLPTLGRMKPRTILASGDFRLPNE
jgi:hypothetical protein